MTDYPSSLYNPAALTDGVDYPQAAHINTLRDEVRAIEATLDTNFGGATPAQGDILYRSSSGEWTRLAAGTSGYVLSTQGAAADPHWIAASSYTAPAGSALQQVNTQTGAVATGTTVLPNDDTIPQNTEGIEFMTLAITPTSATSKLLIEVVINVSNSVSNPLIAALFQDSTAGALAAMSHYQVTAAGAACIKFTHYMTAGTTSATTFKVRAGGPNAGTTTFNGISGGRVLGGVMASSITITEIKV